jgi:hypothetical protein
VTQRWLAVQLFRRDSNPLWRAVDRTEATVLRALIVAFLVLWLAVAIVAGRWADQQSIITERAEQGVHSVQATLLESGAQAAVSGEWDVALVRARWPLPDGRTRYGQIATALDAKAGQKQQIFINQAGQQVRPPLNAAGVHDQIAFTVLSVSMLVGVAYAIAFGCVRMMFNRRRMASWQQAWDAIGPTWTRQA